MALSARSWLLLPRSVWYGLGVAGACSIALAIIKVGESDWVSDWFGVALPLLIAITAICLIFTIAVVLWVTTAVKLLAGPSDIEYEGEAFNLDNLFKAAKVCFISHGYSLLLCVGLWLIVAKVEGWCNFSMVYPCLPFIVLGALHVFLAIMFKAPELDAGRSSFIGMSMLGHSVMLILKMDQHLKSSLQWSVVFVPSWFTYTGVLAVCSLHGAYILGMALAKTSKPAEPVDGCLILGLTAWALGFGSSQVLLTLHLDRGWTSAHWELFLLPALLGWCALFLCAASSVSKHFEGVIKTFLDAYGVDTGGGEDDPKMPLLSAPTEGLPHPNWR